MDVQFHDVMHVIVLAFEAVGVALLAVGTLAALFTAFRSLLRGEHAGVEIRFRSQVGRAVLVGLEVLIVADVIGTITVDQTLETALVLALIVLIRTFLSFSINVEIDGFLPWKRTNPETPVTPTTAD
jgi:uncharacterized membrane protein